MEKFLDKILIKTILKTEMITITEEGLYKLSEKYNVYTNFNLITFKFNYSSYKHFLITEKMKKISEQNRKDREKINLLYK